MKQLYYAMVATALILTQSCSFEESDIKPDIPQDVAYKVQIYNEINQQPATKVTTDGFCTGDEVGVYLVNYDGQNLCEVLTFETSLPFFTHFIE